MSGDYMGIEQLLAQDSETDYSDSEDDCGGDSDASDVARAVDARAADESFGRLDRANAELKAYLVRSGHTGLVRSRCFSLTLSLSLSVCFVARCAESAS